MSVISLCLSFLLLFSPVVPLPDAVQLEKAAAENVNPWTNFSFSGPNDSIYLVTGILPRQLTIEVQTGAVYYVVCVMFGMLIRNIAHDHFTVLFQGMTVSFTVPPNAVILIRSTGISASGRYCW